MWEESERAEETEATHSEFALHLFCWLQKLKNTPHEKPSESKKVKKSQTKGKENVACFATKMIRGDEV